MGISKLMRGVAAAVAFVGVMSAATPANAGIMSVTVWQGTNPGSSITDPIEQALPTNALQFTTPIAQFFYNGSLQWKQTDQAQNTLRDFVGSGGGSVSGCVGSSCNGANALQPTLLSTAPFKLTTLFLIQFTTPTALVNANILHDDGVSIWSYNNTIAYLNSSLPTSEIGNNFNLPGAGTYNIWFVQANGAPTVLKTNAADLSHVPEPTTLALIAAALLSLLCLGASRRRYSFQVPD